MEQIEAIIFDFDGTLIDASESITRTFNAVLKTYQVEAWSAQAVAALIGRPLRVMFAQALGRNEDEDLRDVLEEYRLQAGLLQAPLIELLPGAQRSIQFFQGRIKLGIATSRRSQGTRDILRTFGLTAHFGAVVGIDDVSRPKPDPEPVNLALQRLDVKSGAALFVGDTPDDMAAARAAGVRGVGVCSGCHSPELLRRAGADTVLQSLDGLIDLVSSLSDSSPSDEALHPRAIGS